MKTYECNCGNELELERCEWAKYCFSDCEEVISIYKCNVCNKEFSKRGGNFDLEEIED